jgi:Mce-associated membrane protein
MEGDAGETSQLNPTDENATSEEVVTEAPAEEVVSEESASANPDTRQPSLLGRGWLVTICVALVVLSGAVAAGGYLAMRANTQSQADARAEAAALAAAKECVAVTQAPDIAAMAASQRQIIECSTGDFGVQATIYSGVLVDAYQAANAQVQVSDMRAAVERHNDDGTIQVLVAVRVKITNSAAADQESGYRLRVKMAEDGGKYKIARLDQVST